MKCRLMRLIRKKYDISTVELAERTGLSQQRVSELELDENKVTAQTEATILRGFTSVIYHRRNRLAELESDFRRYSGRLMALVDEEDML